MKIRSAVFHTSAPSLDTCPEPRWPEFAFIGRSNVGKSSLLNALTGQNTLAKVSATPGHTKLINFFTINNAWSMVDLPGYGYARTQTQGQGSFEAMIAGYLEKRTNLAAVFVLLDARHSPQKIDLEFVQWLVGCDVPLVLVFTKIDKAKPSLVSKNVELFQKELAQWCSVAPPAFLTSAQTGVGRYELLGFIEKMLAAPGA